jgi:hypothetical protein
MTGTSERMMVAFSGEGSGGSGLSWGQKEYWSAVVARRTWGPLGGVRPLPPGTTLDDVADELRYLMSRYQPLRTRLKFDAEGRPGQVVFASGELPVELVDAGDTEPGSVADAVHDRCRDAGLDFAEEWPIRTAVVLADRRPTHLILLISHFAVDATGGAIMMAEAADRTDAPVPPLQPLAQAAWQQSPAGRRQNAAVMRYWEGILRLIEPRRFPERRGEEQKPRYWHGEFDSPGLYQAARTVAARSGLETSTVLLAAFAVAWRGIAGINPVVVRPIVSNRFRPGLREVVCTLAQGGLCVLDVTGPSFLETLGRVKKAELSAFKHAYFDHDDMVELRERISRERGVEIDTSCYYNDRRGPSRLRDDAPVLTPRQIRDTAAPSTFKWILAQDAPEFEPLFVHIDDVPDTIRVTLHLDTRFVSAADGEALMYGMEQVALAAASEFDAG